MKLSVPQAASFSPYHRRSAACENAINAFEKELVNKQL